MPNALRILIAGILVLKTAAMADEPVRVPWNRVAVLVGDADVTVETANKRKKVGRVVKVQPDSIELRTQTGIVSLPSTEVARIRVHGRNHAPAWTLVGAAAGAGLFALAAHPPTPLFKDGGLYQRNADGTQTKLDTSPHPNYGLAAAIGAGIGGVTGWWASRLSRSRGMTIEVVPVAQPSPPPAATQMNRGGPP